MVSITGYIDHIVFRNEENGYTVFQLTEGKKEHICVGALQCINEGEYVCVTGEEVIHPVYDKQIKVNGYEIKIPEDEEAILRYLGSGAIKGIGLKMADRIVRKFGKDTLIIIEKEPERLAQIKGITTKKAMEISDQLIEKRDMRNAMMYLQKFGISTKLSIKIYNKYLNRIYDIMENNPYKLADEIDGVGFKIADEIARNAGVSMNSEFRINSGIIYALNRAGLSGHTYLPMDILETEVKKLLDVEIIDLKENLVQLITDKRITVRNVDNIKAVYGIGFYKAEVICGKKLLDLNFIQNVDEKKAYKKINSIESELDITLDEKQKMAIYMSITNGVLVITGGPGTGKTTTINAIISYFEQRGDVVKLAAPTGRAAKRMTEATGYEAQTLHRMLEFTGGIGDESINSHFERNNDNPLEADVIIVDEMSMVDIFIMKNLLEAIPDGTRLIMVGDVDQLPSVNPGNVLKDIIESKAFNVVKLDRIFRQANESEIITNAHRINKGMDIEYSNKKDFIYIERNEANRVAGVITTLIKEKLPKYVNAKMLDIQVLSPSRIGNLGTINLNNILQEQLNPKDNTKRECLYKDVVFREGDKVMQIKNNYQILWEKRGSYGVKLDEGMGIFNGDMGIINRINSSMEVLEIIFDDDKYVIYDFKNLEELELAYAVTIHKSQGSEYPAVIIPVVSGPKMLMNRNVLYTGVTRAKSCVCLVGSKKVISEMINNIGEYRRFSGLDDRIREMQEDNNNFN